MKKLLSVFLSVIQLSLFGAANSDALTNPEPDYVLPQPPAMDEQKVAIALECLPERLNEFVRRIDKRTLKNGAYLFVGPPGNGKTIAARAIGQQFYRERSYFFAGSSLVGDRYINSGKETIQANFKPLVQLAKSAPLFVVIDEFQKLMKKKMALIIEVIP